MGRRREAGKKVKREKPVGNQGLGEADATAEIDRRAAIKWASRYQRSGPCTANTTGRRRYQTASMSSASAVQANRVRVTGRLGSFDVFHVFNGC